MTVNSVTGVDHVIIRADDLDVIGDNFRKLGFKLTEPRVNQRGSSNHTAVFDDNYIELSYLPRELRDSSQTQAWGPYVVGLSAVGLKTPSSARVHDELVEIGYKDVQPLVEGGRPVLVEGHGDFQTRWENQRFPAEASTLPTLFTCQHLTRDLVHRNDYRAHPNGAISVRELILVHTDVATLKSAYRRLWGEAWVIDDAAGFTVTLGVTTFRYISPAEFATRYPGIAVPADLSRGWYAGWVIAVASIDKVVDIFKKSGVASKTSKAGGLIPDTGLTAGAVIELRQF